MQYTWQALAAAWVIVLGVFALIASARVTGIVLLLVVLGGVVGPAIILAADERRRKGARIN